MKDWEIGVLILLVIGLVFVVTTAANPCWFSGHIPMADCPQDFSIILTGDTSVRWSGVVNVCGRKFHVCQRCGLVYVERAEAEAGKKP